MKKTTIYVSIVLTIFFLSSCVGKDNNNSMSTITTVNDYLSAETVAVIDNSSQIQITYEEPENSHANDTISLDATNPPRSTVRHQNESNITTTYIPAVPTEGMSVSEMNGTKLGTYDERSEEKIGYYAHGTHSTYYYWWENAKGNVYFAAMVTDGKVVSTSKYFTDFWDGDTYTGTKLHG